MTRTERATSPRAILKDRSESKSGMDKRTPKGGAGNHNWGSLMKERDLEEAALYDQEVEDEDAGVVEPSRPAEPRRPSTHSISEEDRQEALKVRKDALKKDVDLAAIARSSAAVSVSGPQPTTAVMSDADTADSPVMN